eukprot:GEMP01034631.1.p1 GENE.GEMP01034631.1~~GEMP01034631.1.p1  ORF type:complete len:390 (+),score=116.81 GEMP01034631.1:90-1172(+)
MLSNSDEAPPQTFTVLPQIDANLIFAQNMACMAMVQAQQWETYATKMNLHAIQKKRAANPPRFALIRADKENNEMVSRFLQQASSSSSTAPAGEQRLASAAIAAPRAPPAPPSPAAGTHSVHTTSHTTTTRTVHHDAQHAAQHAVAEAQLAHAAAEAAHAMAHAAVVEAATEAARRQNDVAAGLIEQARVAPAPADAQPQPPRDNAWVRNRMGFFLKFAFLLVLFEATLLGLLLYFFVILLYLYGMFDGLLGYFAVGRHPALDQQLVNLRIRREEPQGQAAAAAAGAAAAAAPAGAAGAADVAADVAENAAGANGAAVNAGGAAPPAAALGGFWRAFYQSFVMFFLTLAPWWTPDPRHLQ